MLVKFKPEIGTPIPILGKLIAIVLPVDVIKPQLSFAVVEYVYVQSDRHCTLKFNNHLIQYASLFFERLVKKFCNISQVLRALFRTRISSIYPPFNRLIDHVTVPFELAQINAL
jgi:hypothetical protein